MRVGQWAWVLFKRMQHSAIFCFLLQKNVAFFAFFYIFGTRTLHSLHSFTFLRKERKRMHRSFGFHKLPILEKRMQKNIVCFKRTQKNDSFRMQKNVVPNHANQTRIKTYTYLGPHHTT